MDRLKLFVLNKTSQFDGIYNIYLDAASVLGFLNRTGRTQNFSILATKGKRSLFIEKIDPATLAKDITNFANQQ